MWTVHNANRMERLADGLATLLRDRPAGPFAAEPVLVQNRGLGRWVRMALAERLGAVANLELALPASFLWRTVAAQLGPQTVGDPLSRDQLAWRLFAELPALRDADGFGALQRYLAADRTGRGAWRLAERLADIYDQYLVYRPDWIRDWDAGGAPGDWQADLWRRIARPGHHRVGQLDAFFGAARDGRLDAARLPERVTLFGVSSLPPILLQALHALSSAVDVHIFFLNPCQYFWGDIVSARQRVRTLRNLPQAQGEQVAPLLDDGQPLLASLGRQGQDFLNQLYAGEEGGDTTAFDDPAETAATLLGDLQSSLLNLDGGEPVAGFGADGSIRVVRCHGPQRECQALHDALLELFERHPGLEPRDVVVMAPDIDRYAPYIEGVFADQLPGRSLPWAITDRRGDEAHPLLQLVATLLALPELRITRSEVLGLFEVPALCRRFGLDVEGLSALRRLVDDSGARWGLDDDDRVRLELPADRANGWAWAEERMLLGYALPPRERELYDGLAPLGPLDGSGAQAAGALSLLLDRLRDFRDRMREPQTLPEWRRLVEELLAALLAPDADEEEVLGHFRGTLAEVVERAAKAGFGEPVSLDVVRAALEEGLREPATGSSYLAGAVTFCSFQPMRSIPFRVVCLIGMNETDFPRRVRAPDFDRIAHGRRRSGDRSHRDGDRYAFLEALLSARDALYISHVGRDIRDDTERQPSVVVAELLDWLDRRHPAGDGEATLSSRITLDQPLQPFSPTLFAEGHAGWSYSHRWGLVCRAARELAEPLAPLVGDTPLPAAEPADDAELEIETLRRFFNDPPRAFLQQRLGIHLRDMEADDDEEPFAVDGLAGYRLREGLLEALEAGDAPEAAAAWLRAQGGLPHGLAGDHAWAVESGQVASLRERLAPYAGTPCADLEFEQRLEVDGEPVVLRGWIDRLRHEHGRVAHRPGSMKLGNVVEAWLHYLLLRIAAPAGLPARSTYVSRERLLVFGGDGRPAPGVAEATQLLAELVRIYRLGMAAPLPLFPETSWQYVRIALIDAKSEEYALREAAKRWQGDYQHEGESTSRPYARVAGRGLEEPLEATGGRELLDRLFAPILEHGWFSDGK